MDDFEKELKLDFLDEATQLLESTEQAFLELEDDFSNKGLIDEIFRFAHNLKGTSRAVGFGIVAEFTHEVENLILKIKQNEVEINEFVVSVLLESNDAITKMIVELKDNFDATFDHSEVLVKIEQAIGGTSASEPVQEAVQVEEEVPAQVKAPQADPVMHESVEINEELLRELEGIDIPESNELKVEDIPAEEPKVEAVAEVPVTPEPKKDLEGLKVFEGKENVTNKPAAKPSTANKPKLKEDKRLEKDESIRVSLSRVETLNNFVGELVILQSVLEQQKFKTIRDELAIKSIGQLGKLCKEIQDISMSLRMVPVKSTLQKMSRIVRDTSKTLGKKVKLKLSGEETEIDKTVLEHIADPLVHIVRNAIDHGLESTEGRIDAGKPEAGDVRINAFHEGNNLVIEVSDDGKGINPDVIRGKAIDKGIITENSNIDDQEVIQLIFHPGFSTKDKVSEVSGRGVGMDVVKTNIEKLNGEVRVTTKVGEGSVFKIMLPLTMAIIDGMIITVGENRFVIPISQIQESLRPSTKDLGYNTGLGDCLNLRGTILPILKVSSLLKLPMDEKPLEKQIVIIAKSKNGLTAIAVDDIIQQQQVVIKTLGNEIKDQKGFMGSSILGDGKPAFIIDVDDLCSNTNKSGSINNMVA